MESKKVLKSQSGFTLIEIIAVLVVLGILAAIAVPRYIDLQDDAYAKGAEGGVAAAQSALSLAYAQHLLGGDPPTPADVCTNDVIIDAPDDVTFTVTCDGEDWDIESSAITATYGGQTASGTWTNPGYVAP